MPEQSTDYVTMPQNDAQQIEQIVREYESDPSRGLAHGVQKDAIQNGFGARMVANEKNACEKSWSFSFELVKINGAEALVFWDSGTYGLTGDILSVDEIEQKSASGSLGSKNANQRLARFLTRFESGGNLGAGSFGRGKLIFQGASEKGAIIVESLRSDDKKYIAFDRKIIGTQLKQQRTPYIDDKAKEFIKDATKGGLKPLVDCGTRITILNVKEEIVKAFKKSFEEDADSGDYSEVFSKMVEETWWEILQFGAKIYLKWGEKKRKICFTDPLCSILQSSNNNRGYKTYEENNIPVVVDGSTHKIKHLKFVVAPNPILEEFREFWVQRKRMKIGTISRGINPHHKIYKNCTGYLILDPDLEGLFEKIEGPTHYGFVMRGRPGGAISQVREIIRGRLEIFQEKMGLRSQGGASKARQDMLDALKELNEQANELGLPTDFSGGTPKKIVEISIDSFSLPNPATTRVELGDSIGPIVYLISNNTNSAQNIKVRVSGEQRNRESFIIIEKEIDLKGNGKETISAQFNINAPQVISGEGLLIRAEVINRASKERIHQVSRILWVGMDQPDKLKDLLEVTGYIPDFPRPKTRRVELNEAIRNIRFKVSNNTGEPLKVNLDLKIRKSADARDLASLISERNLELPPLAEKEFAYAEVKITKELFGGIFDEAANAKERRCEIFFSIRAAENYPGFQKVKGDHIGPKKAIPFYCGVDPAGMSIFKNLDEKNEENDGRRSWVEGDKASGYTFILNVGHSSYKLSDELGDEFRKYHIREQMLFHAYLLAVGEGVFKGPAEKFDGLFDENIQPLDAARYMDEIVGAALNKIG